MDHPLLFIVLITLTLSCGYAKPVHEEILPHSRDYYAGYIKAITDNFDQLFPNERKIRSATDELDENESSDNVDHPHSEEKRSLNEGTDTTTKKDIAEKKQTVEKKNPNDDGEKKERKNQEEETHKKDDVMKMEIHDEHPTEVNDLESKNNILQPANDEADDETQMDNTQSEDEKENNDEDDEDDEIRRNYILEHADYGNAPSLPRIVSGFRENPNMQPFDPNFMQEPMSFSGFPMPQPYGPSFVESSPPRGETRSVIKRGRKISHKKSNCPDSHHLDRVLVLPQHHCCGGCCDTVHTGCCGNDYCCNGDSNCGCCGSDCCCNGHRNCGYQNSLCDVHHWPVGCHEYYSHESPCLTYPSTQRVRYGYPTNGCGCGCGTAPYHSHHPVILHPTYQECNHHNIHTIGTNCQTPCHVTTPCHQTHIHHRINHVHHVYPHRCQNTCGCNTGCNCLRNADIQILPHYGHTSRCGCGGCGCHGWNPYWGY